MTDTEALRRALDRFKAGLELWAANNLGEGAEYIEDAGLLINAAERWLVLAESGEEVRGGIRRMGTDTEVLRRAIELAEAADVNPILIDAARRWLVHVLLAAITEETPRRISIRRGWTDEQWIDDARLRMGRIDGSILDLINGHVLALLRRIDELEGRCSPERHGGRPCEVAAIAEKGEEGYVEQWKYADASWCHSRGHDPRVETLSHCRWTVMSGDGGPKPGHEGCEPLLTADGISRLLDERKQA